MTTEEAVLKGVACAAFVGDAGREEEKTPAVLEYEEEERDKRACLYSLFQGSCGGMDETPRVAETPWREREERKRRRSETVDGGNGSEETRRGEMERNETEEERVEDVRLNDETSEEESLTKERGVCLKEGAIEKSKGNEGRKRRC